MYPSFYLRAGQEVANLMEALVAGSVNVPMLVTLRFIQGIGLGM